MTTSLAPVGDIEIAYVESGPKDAPAVLLAVLAMRSDASNNLVRNVFNRVIRTGKMLSNLVAIFRSGALGRNTIPRPVRRMINDLINGRDPEWLWRANIGVTDPSMGDIIKMTHPRGAAPGTQDHAVRELLLGRPVENLNTLPDNIADYENFKRARLERRRPHPHRRRGGGCARAPASGGADPGAHRGTADRAERRGGRLREAGPGDRQDRPT